MFNRKILTLAQPVLQFCSIKTLESHPTRDAILGHFNLSETLFLFLVRELTQACNCLLQNSVVCLSRKHHVSRMGELWSVRD